MKEEDILKYFQKVTGISIKTDAQRKNVADKLTLDATNCLSLTAFLSYYTDIAIVGDEKNIWRDLTVFNFRNDLSRSTGKGLFEADSCLASEESSALVLPDNCIESLSNVYIYQIGMIYEKTMFRLIFKRFCLHAMRIKLFNSSLSKIFEITQSTSYYDSCDTFLNLLCACMKQRDGMMKQKLKEILTNQDFGLFTCLERYLGGSR